MAVKLSETQQRALRKLREHGGWECSYSLSESMATLDALVKKGFARCRGYGKVGAMFSPQTVVEYKAK